MASLSLIEVFFSGFQIEWRGQWMGNVYVEVCRVGGFEYTLNTVPANFLNAKASCRDEMGRLAGLQTDLDRTVFKEAL